MAYFYPPGERPTRDYPGWLEPGNPDTCSLCSYDFDLDDDEHFEIDGKPCCKDCRPVCLVCGEFVDDKIVDKEYHRVTKNEHQAQVLQNEKDIGMFDIMNTKEGYGHAGCIAANILLSNPAEGWDVLSEMTKEEINERSRRS